MLPIDSSQAMRIPDLINLLLRFEGRVLEFTNCIALYSTVWDAEEHNFP